MKKTINKVDLQIPVSITKDGSVFVAYTPALDLSTYGSTEHEAKKSFSEIVEIFFEEFIDEPRALEEVLGSLGWKKQKNNWEPPVVKNTIQDIKVSLAV